MSEQHELTTPSTTPGITTSGYKVRAINMDIESGNPMATEKGLLLITLKDNNGTYTNYRYEGEEAVTLIKQINTGNFSKKSLQKMILQKLENDGKIGAGNVTGTPDA